MTRSQHFSPNRVSPIFRLGSKASSKASTRFGFFFG